MADQHDSGSSSTAPAEFPTNGPSTYYEIWEYHGETPVRSISLGVWERGYVNRENADEDAEKLAADPRWTRFKVDPSFRVVTVTITRTPTASAP